jgi:hypothetical protein
MVMRVRLLAQDIGRLALWYLAAIGVVALMGFETSKIRELLAVMPALLLGRLIFGLVKRRKPIQPAK